jgi:hypothetical protein
MAIEIQNLSREMAHAYLTGTAIKPVFFVISGRNSGEIESVFHYELCKTNPISERPK